jgi:hypothetical protein
VELLPVCALMPHAPNDMQHADTSPTDIFNIRDATTIERVGAVMKCRTETPSWTKCFVLPLLQQNRFKCEDFRSGRFFHDSFQGFDLPRVSHQPCLMNVPSFNSSTACRNCAWVFITMGPYHATGSSIGFPDTSRNRMPSGPACTVSSSPRSNSTRE